MSARPFNYFLGISKLFRVNRLHFDAAALTYIYFGSYKSCFHLSKQTLIQVILMHRVSIGTVPYVTLGLFI